MQSKSTSALSPLRATRKAQGLSLRKVADQAGLDAGHLSRAERGHEGLSVDSLARVARTLGLDDLAVHLEPYRRAGRDAT